MLALVLLFSASIISLNGMTANADTIVVNDGKLHIKINNTVNPIAENVGVVGETNYLTVDASLDGDSDIPLSYEWEVKIDTALDVKIFSSSSSDIYSFSKIENYGTYFRVFGPMLEPSYPFSVDIAGYFNLNNFTPVIFNDVKKVWGIKVNGESNPLSISKFQLFGKDSYAYPANSNKLNLAGFAKGTYTLRCKISHPNADTVYSNEVTATISDKPVLNFSISPTTKTCYLDDPYIINITGSVTNPFDDSLKFEWFNGENIISNVSGTSFDTKSLPVGTHTIKCKITANYADTKELTSTVTIKNRPTISVTTQPTSKPIVWNGVGDKISVNSTLTYGLTADQNVKYQWYQNDVAISGQTATTLDLSALKLDVGQYDFKCKMTSTDAIDVFSNVSKIDVKKLKILINKQPDNIRMVVGTEMKLVTEISLNADVKNVSYKWVVNNIALENETTSELQLENFEKGTYEIYCEITADDEIVRTNTSFVEITAHFNQTIFILVFVAFVLICAVIIIKKLKGDNRK